MKFNIYGSFTGRSCKHKLIGLQIYKLFSKHEIEKMCSLEGHEIIKGNVKYWVKEAINYGNGVSARRIYDFK